MKEVITKSELKKLTKEIKKIRDDVYWLERYGLKRVNGLNGELQKAYDKLTCAIELIENALKHV